MSSESVNFESLFERLQQLFDSKSKLNTDQIISCLDQQLKLIETISISDIPSIYLESFHTAFYKWLIRFQDDIQISEKLCQIFANLSRKGMLDDFL